MIAQHDLPSITYLMKLLQMLAKDELNLRKPLLLPVKVSLTNLNHPTLEAKLRVIGITVTTMLLKRHASVSAGVNA